MVTTLKKIEVEEGNTAYQSIDGVLYSIDGTRLLCYPAAKVDKDGKACTSYTIPDTVTSFAVHAFNGCTYLETLDIGDGITSINVANPGICNCDNLKYLTVGANFDFGLIVTKDDKKQYAMDAGEQQSYSTFLSNLKGLVSVTVDENNANYKSVDGVLYTKGLSDDKVVLLCYPAAKGGSFTIPSDVTMIGYNAFEYCSNLILTIGENVTSISSKAFMSCTNLTFNAANDVDALTINGNAFAGCTGTITLGNNAVLKGSIIYVYKDTYTSSDLMVTFAKTGYWTVTSSGETVIQVIAGDNYFDKLKTDEDGNSVSGNWVYFAETISAQTE